MKTEWNFRRELRPRAVPGLVRLGNPLGDGGYDVPEVVEVTFVHRSLMPAGSPYSSDERPLPGLDMPNSPGVPDYVLRL